MNDNHLRLVRDDPPDLDDDEGGDGDGDEILAVEISISADVYHTSRVVLALEDVTADVLARAVLAVCRGVIAAYGNRDVSMSFERLLLEQWGTPDEQ